MDGLLSASLTADIIMLILDLHLYALNKQMYFVVSILKHLEPAICRSCFNETGDLLALLTQQFIIDFSAAVYVRFMHKLRDTYRNVFLNELQRVCSMA